jgi:hypothetical protein
MPSSRVKEPLPKKQSRNGVAKIRVIREPVMNYDIYPRYIIYTGTAYSLQSIQ